MTPSVAKRHASAAGLELYWDTQWRSWGLILPDGLSTSEGSIWLSSGELHGLDRETFAERYIAPMVERLEIAQL